MHSMPSNLPVAQNYYCLQTSERMLDTYSDRKPLLFVSALARSSRGPSNGHTAEGSSECRHARDSSLPWLALVAHIEGPYFIHSLSVGHNAE